MSFLSVISTGLSIFGQLRQEQQEQSAFLFNAAINQQQAELTRQAGDIQIARLRRQKRTFGAKQEAAFAAAGVRLTGSPLQVLADTSAELELDIQIEDFNTRIGILNAQTSAELDIIRGNIARQSSFIAAGTTLLSQIPNFISSQNRARTITTSVVPSTSAERTAVSDSSSERRLICCWRARNACTRSGSN